MLERTLSGPKPETTLPPGATDTQMHMYLPGFPSEPGGPPLPPGLPGPVEYRQVMDWLGIERVVITQGNAHQANNDCLLACLSAMGACARGVAVIGADTGEAELRHLHNSGVRGARIMDLPGGTMGIDRLAEVDAITAAWGWCLAVQFDGANLLTHFDRLAAIRSRWILDHHGKFLTGLMPGSAEIDAIKRLIDGGNCWFKFAGCYESSRQGGPDFADIAAYSSAIAQYAPERIIWGSNWPHNLIQRTENYPDDARLLDTVLSWIGSSKAQHHALVDNPAVLFDFPS